MADSSQFPFPPSGGFIDAVRTSCEACRQRANISLPSQSIDSFLLSLSQPTFLRLKDSHGLSNMPLQFSSPLDELNVVSVLALLNFLHCYRVGLHERTGRGAWQTIRYLVLAAYVSSADGSPSLLSTEGMRSVTPHQIADLLNLPLHTERPHPSLPIKIGEPDALAVEIVSKLVEVLQGTGRVLKQDGYADLGGFVVKALEEGQGSSEVLVEKLVRAFPAFRDMYTIDKQPVYLFKKAMFLCLAVGQTFTKPNRPPPPFPIPQTSDLPIFSDNVIPTMMVHFGLIDISNSSDPNLARGLVPTSSSPSSNPSRSQDITPGVDLPTHSAATIRAAAVSAADHIVLRAHFLANEEGKEGKEGRGWMKEMKVIDLDAYLWAVAKDTEELRGVPRLTEMGTVMY